MFQYAALIGICVSKGFHPDYCASLEHDHRNKDLKHFFETFRITHVRCPINGVTYHENAHSKYVSMYDGKVSKQLNGAIFSGHFHSYKYFHPHARSIVLEKFRFPYKILKAAQEFLRPFLQDSEYETVCVHIRLGDKADNTARTYQEWSTSSDYYHKAISIMKRMLGNIKLIIFTGGSLHTSSKDHEWAKTNIIESYTRNDNVSVFVNTTSLDPMTVMKTMALCPNLVMSASTFSWWAAYLGEHKNVIAPQQLYKTTEFKPEDYYLSSWTLINK